ncbi:MAG: hypothetical protein O8C66_03060 [Candidatus Methanoperedens sp.]|nr:hypothetical protein [Candidatus Methanoperedens sp.]MCZ7369467.1 hypothetical protein [Candidatus Methanoperedens sp.]
MNNGRNMDEIKTTEKEKDEVLDHLESMLKRMPENARQPILNLINKRKVELGLMKSELPLAGYKLKKRRSKPRQSTKEINDSRESLKKIAMNVGIVAEKQRPIKGDIDIKNEPLKKEKKAIEEADSYKY